LASVYDIGEKLGKGSYAVVHRAIHKATGEAFAVKIISKEKSKEKRLKSEVSLACPDFSWIES
jgi:serine/threonine protein kinase